MLSELNAEGRFNQKANQKYFMNLTIYPVVLLRLSPNSVTSSSLGKPKLPISLRRLGKVYVKLEQGMVTKYRFTAYPFQNVAHCVIQVLATILVFFASLASRDPRDLPDLASKSDFVSVLFKLLGSWDRENDPLWLISCGLSDAELKKAGISKGEKLSVSNIPLNSKFHFTD